MILLNYIFEAIKDTMYTKDPEIIEAINDVEEGNGSETDTVEEENELYDDVPLVETQITTQALKPNILEIVSKVRAIASFFSRSGFAQDILESNCKRKSISVSKIQVDCPTRWSSLYEMLHTFNLLLPAIKPTFKSIDKELNFELEELDKLFVIIF